MPQLDVIIQRVYPKLFMETVKDANGEEVKVTRSEKDEEYEVKANEVKTIIFINYFNKYSYYFYRLGENCLLKEKLWKWKSEWKLGINVLKTLVG